ncbi:homogentisate 1,2-dioxygenase [bacterium]|nr:MAG: homogentisate 1,2-dioxygenase [bacterium]
MIDRQCAGILPDKPHTICRDPEGNLLFEEMHTRGGFSGPFSYFYHRYPVTANREVSVSSRGYPKPVALDEARLPLRRRLYGSGNVTPGGQLVDCRVPILFNRDVTILLARPTQSDDVYFANGDGDELWFVQEGTAQLESPCGWLDVVPGDYVFVPRSLVHRWHITSKELRLLGFEAHDGLFVPNQFRNPVGQLRMDAPYTHRDFVRPKGPISTPGAIQDGPREVVVKKLGDYSRFELQNPPMDVLGWDGFVYPWAFNIEKYQPKTGLVHLPPTIHATFESKGFLICSFVPRVTDTHPQAIPCPYPHSSVDCDEVILYLRGNFTSRRGVGPGSISLHPSGVVHGPHPGAYEASIGSKRTDELAVMIDTFLPLMPTAQAAAIEDTAYHDSWKLT